MAFTREVFLEKILDSYSVSYDVAPASDEAVPLQATADLHVSESQFMISKKAKMWSVDNDEFVYFFSVPHLTDAMCEQCIQYAYDEGMKKIDLDNPNHMCTRLVALFLYESAEEAAVTRLTKCRIYKSFQFSLKGWMEFHTAAVDFGKESVVSNRAGKETADYLKSVLHPQPRRKGKRIWSIIKEMLH